LKTIFCYTKPLAMKNLLFLTSYFLIFTNGNAQVPTAMPPDANAFYNKVMPVIRPQLKDIVLQTANAIKHYNANADSLSQRLHKNNALKSISNNDIDGITLLIMVQASRNADSDLKDMVIGMSRNNEQKKQQRPATQQVSVNNSDTKARSQEEISEMQNIKLLVIMERKRRMAEEICNIMKKIADTQQNILNDLK
jgi:hypothetical protein